jgi:hypothetical protein
MRGDEYHQQDFLRCRFCGGIDPFDPDHEAHCDGRQGGVEDTPTDVNPWHNVRVTDPDTSHDAALDYDEATRDTDRARALRALREAGAEGLTDYELAERIGRQQNSAGKRRGELRDRGLVTDSGRRRPAPSGASAIVWVAVEIKTKWSAA